MPCPVTSAGVSTESVTEKKNYQKCKVHSYRKESVGMWTNPAGPWKENWEMRMAMQNQKCLKNHLKKILMHRNWEWPTCFCCHTSIKQRASICEPKLHPTEGNPSNLNNYSWFSPFSILIYDLGAFRKSKEKERHEGWYIHPKAVDPQPHLPPFLSKTSDLLRVGCAGCK